MELIYLDSCMLVYAVEDTSSRGDVVRERLNDPGIRLAISPLVVMECLVGPFRADNLPLRDRFTQAFAHCDMLPLGLPEFTRAAELRARHSLRTPDALHLAVAQLNGCHGLWTNDSRLGAASAGLAVDRVSG